MPHVAPPSHCHTRLRPADKGSQEHVHGPGSASERDQEPAAGPPAMPALTRRGSRAAGDLRPVTLRGDVWMAAAVGE